MTQSLSKIYVHLTFGTKYRHSTIQPYMRDSLNSYVTGIFSNMNCAVIQINCVSDHMHALFRLPKSIIIAAIVEEVKNQSSRWMKTAYPDNSKFYWQSGYGAFSVGYLHLDRVIYYIENQQAHLNAVTYKEEVRELMKENNIAEFKEEFFWQ